MVIQQVPFRCVAGRPQASSITIENIHPRDKNASPRVEEHRGERIHIAEDDGGSRAGDEPRRPDRGGDGGALRLTPEAKRNVFAAEGKIFRLSGGGPAPLRLI